MASSLILCKLLALILVHESLAIKCIVQPDPEEKQKFSDHLFNAFWHGPPDQRKNETEIKEDFMKVIRSRAVVDCADDENYTKRYKSKSAHCASLDLGTCPEVPSDYAEYGVKLEELSGLFIKTCTHTPIGMESSTGHVKKRAPRFGFDNWNNPDYYYVCSRLSKFKHCSQCYQCDEADRCNEGPKKNVTEWWEIMDDTTKSTTTTTGKGTTTMAIGTEKRNTKKAESEETTVAINGAGLATIGQVPALFLLFLAIASGAFCWAVFR